MMKRIGNKSKKVCFDLIPIESIRRCSANIPYNFVPRLKPKKEQETPTPLILSIPEHMTYYSDDEKNCKNCIIKPNRKISKIIRPSNNTKSSKQVGYKKIASCCVKDENRLKWDEDINEAAIKGIDLFEEDNLFICAKGNVNLFPKSRASIFKAIEKNHLNNDKISNSKTVIDMMTSQSGRDLVMW